MSTRHTGRSAQRRPGGSLVPVSGRRPAKRRRVGAPAARSGRRRSGAALRPPTVRSTAAPVRTPTASAQSRRPPRGAAPKDRPRSRAGSSSSGWSRGTPDSGWQQASATGAGGEAGAGSGAGSGAGAGAGPGRSAGGAGGGADKAVGTPGPDSFDMPPPPARPPVRKPTVPFSLVTASRKTPLAVLGPRSRMHGHLHVPTGVSMQTVQRQLLQSLLQQMLASHDFGNAACVAGALLSVQPESVQLPSFLVKAIAELLSRGPGMHVRLVRFFRSVISAAKRPHTHAQFELTTYFASKGQTQEAYDNMKSILSQPGNRKNVLLQGLAGLLAFSLWRSRPSGARVARLLQSARTHFALCLEASPGQPVATLFLAKSQQLLEDTRRARATIVHHLNNHPDETDVARTVVAQALLRRASSTDAGVADAVWMTEVLRPTDLLAAAKVILLEDSSCPTAAAAVLTAFHAGHASGREAFDAVAGVVEALPCSWHALLRASATDFATTVWAWKQLAWLLAGPLAEGRQVPAQPDTARATAGSGRVRAASDSYPGSGSGSVVAAAAGLQPEPTGVPWARQLAWWSRILFVPAEGAEPGTYLVPDASADPRVADRVLPSLWEGMMQYLVCKAGVCTLMYGPDHLFCRYVGAWLERCASEGV